MDTNQIAEQFRVIVTDVVRDVLKEAITVEHLLIAFERGSNDHKDLLGQHIRRMAGTGEIGPIIESVVGGMIEEKLATADIKNAMISAISSETGMAHHSLIDAISESIDLDRVEKLDDHVKSIMDERNLNKRGSDISTDDIEGLERYIVDTVREMEFTVTVER